MFNPKIENKLLIKNSLHDVKNLGFDRRDRAVKEN